jgi:predicted nucleotidyltransferase
MEAGVLRVLSSFTEAARNAFGGELRSVVLFGSAAEDRLRPVSDVNVLVVLRSFDAARADALRDELRLARAAVALRPMFVLDSELPSAMELFAVKFGDVARRHRVLHGEDPFAGVSVPRAARVISLRRSLLNLSMRLRERIVSTLDDERAAVLAEFASAVRAVAAEWLALRDGTAPAPREALLQAARDLGGPGDADAFALLTPAREGGDVPADRARDVLLRLAALVGRMSEKVAQP